MTHHPDQAAPPEPAAAEPEPGPVTAEWPPPRPDYRRMPPPVRPRCMSAAGDVDRPSPPPADTPSPDAAQCPHLASYIAPGFIAHPPGTADPTAPLGDLWLCEAHGNGAPAGWPLRRVYDPQPQPPYVIDRTALRMFFGAVALPPGSGAPSDVDCAPLAQRIIDFLDRYDLTYVAPYEGSTGSIDVRAGAAEVDRLGRYIIERFPTEPGRHGRSESAVDVAIRLMEQLHGRRTVPWPGAADDARAITEADVERDPGIAFQLIKRLASNAHYLADQADQAELIPANPVDPAAEPF